MALVVRTNIASNNAINNLNKTSRALARNFEKISSGLRIARAADDAAGLGVADNLRALSTSADQASRNINDGISMIGVADGAASEVSSILTRLRELAVQSASSTLATTERSYITDEQTQLTSEIDRIANVTEFDGTKLIDGSAASISVQVGVRNTSNDRVSVILGSLTSSSLGLSALSLGTASHAQTSIDTLDTAINSVNSLRSKFGAVENRLNSSLNNIETFSEANKTAESRIRDADFGVETASLSKNQILQQAGVAILSQAKNINQGALSLLQ